MKFLSNVSVVSAGTVTAGSLISTGSIVLAGTNNYTITWANPAAARQINVVDPTATSQLMLGVITSVQNGDVLRYDGTKWVNSAVTSGGSIGSTVTGGTTGSVLFVGTSSALAQDNANFFWDDANNRLGIGTASPGTSLDVRGTATFNQTTTISKATTTDSISTSNTELVLEQTGDSYGATRLRLQNRNGVNGAMFEQTHSTTSLVDFIFKTTTAQRNIRFEGRSTQIFSAINEFQIGTAGNPPFVVSDSNVLVRNAKLLVQATGTGSGTGSLAGATLDIQGGVRFRRNPQSANYTMTATDYMVAVTSTAAPRTITLPAANAVAAGQQFVISDESGGASTNNITINRAGSDTIDGATTLVLNRNNATVSLYSNGTDAWFSMINPFGSQGPQGVQGSVGVQGSTGAQGSSGVQGAQGASSAAVTYNTSFTSANLSSGILTVTHGLGQQYVAVAVYNNSNQLIIPNQVTLTSTSVCTVDLTGFTVSGTWRVVVLAAGGSGGGGGNLAIGANVSGGNNNQVLYSDGGGNLAQSQALTFDQTSSKLGVGDSSLLGVLTVTDNAPGANAASLSLYNKGGGTNASVSADFYTTSVNGGIPLSQIKAVDDGNFSNHLFFSSKVPGASSNSLDLHGQISSLGSWVLNNGDLPTNAADGFTYLPGCQGAPTGTPTNWPGVPIVYNTTASTLYAFNSTWKPIGTQGNQGNQGVAGAGTQGNQGNQGVAGAGTQGNQGHQGVAGAGTQGNQGHQGVAGAGTQGNQGHQGHQGADGIQGSAQDVINFVLGNGLPVTVGTDKTNRIYAVSNGSISKAFINAKVGPTGSSLIIDIKKNGTSIWASTPANRLSIAAGSTTGSQTNFDTTAVTAGDLFTIDVVQIGSTTAGQDITVQLLLGVSATPPVQGTQGYQGFQGSAGASGSIGSVIGSGTDKSVLFLGSGGVLAQDNANFNYDSSTQVLTATRFTGGGFPRDFSFLLDIGGNIVAGNDKSPWVVVPRQATPSLVYISAKTPPSGSSIIVDILYSTNGTSFTSLWASNPSNRPSLTDGSYIASTSSFDTTSLPAGALLRIDVVQVGSSTPGSGVGVQLHTQMRNY